MFALGTDDAVTETKLAASPHLESLPSNWGNTQEATLSAHPCGRCRIRRGLVPVGPPLRSSVMPAAAAAGGRGRRARRLVAAAALLTCCLLCSWQGRRVPRLLHSSTSSQRCCSALLLIRTLLRPLLDSLLLRRVGRCSTSV
jgi:hypothetical protein